jgi:hypothetical protein
MSMEKDTGHPRKLARHHQESLCSASQPTALESVISGDIYGNRQHTTPDSAIVRQRSSG